VERYPVNNSEANQEVHSEEYLEEYPGWYYQEEFPEGYEEEGYGYDDGYNHQMNEFHGERDEAAGVGEEGGNDAYMYDEDLAPLQHHQPGPGHGQGRRPVQCHAPRDPRDDNDDDAMDVGGDSGADDEVGLNGDDEYEDVDEEDEFGGEDEATLNARAALLDEKKVSLNS
jgi:hypothetical protein